MNATARPHPELWWASVLVPGWGQLCQGRGIQALIGFVCTVALYVIDWPWGIASHAIAVLDARIWAARR